MFKSKISMFLTILIVLFTCTYVYGVTYYSGIPFSNSASDGDIATWTNSGKWEWVAGAAFLDAGDFTQDSGFLVGTGAGAYQEETGATARTSMGVGTTDSPQFTGIEVGAATDTTVTRTAAGQIAVEGVIHDTIVETITADSNPESITPTVTWDAAKRFVFVVNETSGDGHEVDLSETDGVLNGTVATIINVSAANTITIQDDGGNMETPNGVTITLEPYESVTAVYYSDRWQIIDERSAVSYANLAIRSSANPTTDANTNIALDYSDGGQDPIFIEVYDEGVPDASTIIAKNIQCETFTILEPDSAQSASDDVILKKFTAESFPHGAVITAIHVDASEAISDTLLFQMWSTSIVASATQTTVESIALSTAASAEDNGIDTPAITADYYLAVNLDDAQDDIAFITFTVCYTTTGGE